MESIFYGIKCHIVKSPLNVKECTESLTGVEDSSFYFVYKFVKAIFSGSVLGEAILPLTEY